MTTSDRDFFQYYPNAKSLDGQHHIQRRSGELFLLQSLMQHRHARLTEHDIGVVFPQLLALKIMDWQTRTKANLVLF
jgi:hypothetical protein